MLDIWKGPPAERNNVYAHRAVPPFLLWHILLCLHEIYIKWIIFLCLKDFRLFPVIKAHLLFEEEAFSLPCHKNIPYRFHKLSARLNQKQQCPPTGWENHCCALMAASFFVFLQSHN